MEPSMGMTRHSAKSILETIFRRWFWVAVFAVVFAIGISALYWYQYYSTFRVSATFIPAVQTDGIPETTSGNYSVVVSQSFIKHEEVLDAVAESVDFGISYSELDNAISADFSDTSVAVTVHVEWHNKEQAYEILNALKANLSFAISHSAKAGPIKWLESAEPNDAIPAASRTQTYIVFLAGALAGAVAGAFVSFIIGCFDKRIYDIRKISYNGDVRVIGIVSRQPDNQTAMSESQRQQVTAIAMFLKKLMEIQDSKLVMCISPTAHCGTSTIVQNVAQVLAGIQKHVLIVVIQSEQNRRFIQSESVIVPISPGVDRCVFTWDDRETNPDFDGPISGTLAREAKKYAMVLVDCPPLLANIQMTGLAVGMDVTLLVCGSGINTQDDVDASVSLLSRAEERPIYCVWNFVPRQYGNTYLPIDVVPEQRKGTDESKCVGADVNI